MFGKTGSELESAKVVFKDKGANFAVACIGCNSGNCFLCIGRLLRSNRVESLGDTEPKFLHVNAAIKGTKLG